MTAIDFKFEFRSKKTFLYYEGKTRLGIHMKIPYLAGLVLGLALAIFYLFQESYVDLMSLFSNAFPPFIAGVAVISAAFALKKYWGNPSEKFSKIWVGFTLGMVFWFLGEVGWAIYTLVLGVEIPYPSLADVAWLMGYVPMIIAFHLYLRVFRFAISKTMYLVEVIAVAISSFALYTYLVFPILAGAAEAEMTTLIFDLAYPTLDIVLFGLAMLGLFVFAKGKIAPAWLLINSAILTDVVADLLFSYTTLNGTYYNGHWLELLFHWGYILYALAFYAHRKEL